MALCRFHSITYEPFYQIEWFLNYNTDEKIYGEFKIDDFHFYHSGVMVLDLLEKLTE